jgi:hypothetical protein
MSFDWRTIRLALLLGVACSTSRSAAESQPVTPPPPEEYEVRLRYRITTPRDLHVAQYDAMVEHLKKNSFEFVPPLESMPRTDREDRGKNLLTGLVPSKSVRRLLDNRHVESLLLSPPGFKLPVQSDGPVQVRLELASGFPAARQLDLANQTRVLLGELGFSEAVGYDHRGYAGRPHSRLVGTIGANRLEDLLKDLRREPSGWLAPLIAPADLPAPLHMVNPVIITEVLPDPRPPKDITPPAARSPEHLDKLSDELWALVENKVEQDKIARVEIILAVAPIETDSTWRHVLASAAPSLFIEGRLGAIVTGELRLTQSRALAALPIVSTVRLPRPARVLIDAAVKPKADNRQALSASGLDELHKSGYRGKGWRIAIVDSDFAGFEERVKNKQLPASTRLVDLTTERHPDIYPDVALADPKWRGHGTQCALAAALAAPEAELTLIRIDPAAPYQLRAIAEYINGSAIRSEHIDRRQDELQTDAAVLAQRRAVLLRERRDILESFADESRFDEEYGLLGAVGAWLFSDRQWHLRRMAEFERDQTAHRARERRFDQFLRELMRLRGIHIVSSSLVWNDGYSLGGGSALSRWFDETPQKALWFLAAGNTRGQTWAGMFCDEDGNGAMEFAAPETPRKSELNFLAWQPFERERVVDLPAGATIRVSLQWREPHDPAFFFRSGDPDAYHKPLADLRLIALRQRDPDGKKHPADDFEVVARSGGLPQRLDNSPNSATYELDLHFRVAQPGRYALRIERQLPKKWVLGVDPTGDRHVLRLLDGLAPSGIRPLGKAVLPAYEKTWELRPRLFVEAIDAASSRQGRPLFLDYATDRGTVGMPADSRSVVTVGAANLSKQPRPYSALGPPANLDLIVRPNLFAFDMLDVAGPSVAYGTSLATPFAAGTAATLFQSGLTRERFWQRLRAQPGAVFTKQWVVGAKR